MDRKQLFVAAALLGVFWIALPVPLPPGAAGESTMSCLSESADPLRQPVPIETLEECSRQLPADVELLASLGDRYALDGRVEQAETAYQRVLENDPDYADVRRRLAALMLRRGETAAARKQIETALRVQPNRQALLDLYQP
jgi:tetratricopeptide (TPR) repeat protein